MTPWIELKNVTKRFGKHTAVDRVSLEVPQGVVFALLGENGAGKTTMIRMILGLLEPSDGSVQVLGMNSQTEGAAIREKVGYVPEQPTLYLWMTAAEIGWFTAGFYAGGFEHRYRALIENFRVPPNRKLEKLSKGMRAKVSLSLAMAHQPELLVLDEPTSGLDTLVRHEFLASMVDIAAQGRTVLLSSHQINEVEQVADIVAIMRGGRLLLVRRLDQLKSDTRRLNITTEEGVAEIPTLTGEIIYQRHRRRQWEVLLHGFDAAAINALRQEESIVTVEERTPTLEEIFVAYMQGNGDPSRAEAAGE